MLSTFGEHWSDPWSSTLAALERFSITPESSSPHLSNRPAAARNMSRGGAPYASHTSVSIEIIERLPNSFVTLSWHDPTRCNYEEQLWAPTSAHRSGRCALTGQRFRAGTRVYMPRTHRKTPPLNARAMILASALDHVSERD